MKRLILIAVLCTFAAVPALADLNGAGWDGGTASWTRVSNEFDGRGGEFTLYDYSSTQKLLISNSAYASSTKGQYAGHPESFQTFCLETDEFVASPMRIGVSEAFVDGSQPGSHAYQGGANTNSGDNLGARTAYLYTQFARGNLSGYTYGVTPPGGLSRSETAGVLQRVIWALEDEGGRNGGGTWVNSFFDVVFDKQAEKDLADCWYNVALPSGWTGIGDVRVLQLYWGDGNTQFKQDQLFLTPVPGAILLGLLGLGAAGVKLRKYA